MTVSDGGSRSALYKALSNPDEDFSWQKQANCRGVNPDLFYPKRGQSARQAKEVCAGCTVRDECLDYALRTNEIQGIWGGLSEKARRRIRVSQPAATSARLKRCSRCDTYLNPASFPADASRSDGLAGECRPCRARRTADWKRRQKEAS